MIEPDTLLTQVCGWPLQTIYAGQAVILGVPVYDAPYCDGPTHAGVFIVRENSDYRTVADLRGCDFAFNSVHSNSGMNLPRRAIADIAGGAPFFGSVTETHSQPGNLERVARGEADATCVDCVTCAFFRRHRPHLAAALRVLAATPPSPAIPFVTAAATPPHVRAALAAALHRVADAPEHEAARAGLMLLGVRNASNVDYGVQVRYEQEAVAIGYPDLR
jgi:ABC-type phosphate/phosphonate transport system substrate-binding protein